MKILVVSQSQKNIAVLRALLEGEGHGDVTVATPDALAAAPDAAWDVVVADGLTEDAAGWDVLDQFTARHPLSQIIALASAQTPEILRQAMRVGVREVLTPPVHKSQFHEVLERLAQKVAQVRPPQTRGKVLAFQACKGGSGATFLAANLGWILANEQHKRVALLDLNLQFGDAVLFVHDHVPRFTLADICRQIDRLDASFLTSSMVQVSPTFSVLASPEDPDQAAQIQPAHIDQILRVAREAFDFVVVDLGRAVDAVTLRALDQADILFPVLQETLPFLRDARRMMHMYGTLGYGDGKVHLLVNRFEKGGDITLDDVEKTLGARVYRAIPNSYKAVAASVNQGVPVAKLADHDAVTKSLRELAAELTGAGRGTTGSWFQNLLKS